MSNENTSRSWNSGCLDTYTRTNGTVSETSYPNTPGGSLSRVVIGTDDRKKPVGWMFPTSYTMRQSSFAYPRGWCKAVEHGYGIHRYDGSLYGRVAYSDLRITSNDGVNQVDVDLLSQAESKALNKFLTHGNDRDGTWRPGIAWGERKETAQLLQTTAQRVVNLFKAIKRGDWKRANSYLPNGERKRWKELENTPYGKWLVQNQRRAIKQTPKALASGILEYQNGWKPFMGDVHNAAEALANRKQFADWVITGIGKYEKVEKQWDRSSTDTQWYTNPVVSRYFERTKRVKVRLDATVDNSHLHALAQLGLNNPIADVWELLPLSYIADYFVGVGAWLQSLGAVDGMKFYSGSKTRYYELLVSLESADPAKGEFYGQRRTVDMVREVYNNFPFPIAPLSLKPDRLRLSQLVNMTAVLTSLLSGQNVPYSRMA